ncbi:uncharacterized protein EV420DRAFT_228151 [Desarmillaria tabescens]|uniref:Uncharacterized protein n=1 Tax=Armillaria tabescens TaxID=1929756 RepID=A0AA39TVB5_ARMTA|nr:uncharacterized protein EV420DRAFT_228151 [Desarmillaria tabescens]KAK0460725.1 hypothetical protein EV420DRAFT_228151 [Desarmillaria tabescens]
MLSPLPSLFILAGLAYSANAQFMNDNNNHTTTQRIIAGVVVAVLALIACILCSIGLSRRRRRRLLVVPQGQYSPQAAGGYKPPFFGSGWGWSQQYPPNQNQSPYIPPQGPPHQSTPYYGGYGSGAEQRQEYPPNPPPYKRDDTNYQPVRTKISDVPMLLILTVSSPPDHLRDIQKVVRKPSTARLVIINVVIIHWLNSLKFQPPGPPPQAHLAHNVV